MQTTIVSNLFSDDTVRWVRRGDGTMYAITTGWFVVILTEIRLVPFHWRCCSSHTVRTLPVITVLLRFT